MNSNRVVRFSRGSATVASLLATAGLAALAAGCSGAAQDGAAGTAEDAALSSLTQHPTRQACNGGTGKFQYKCTASFRTDLEQGYTPDFTAVADAFTPDHHPTSVAYGPSDLQSAYGIPDGGKGVTVAIIDAQDDPNAEADLAVFRAKYNLPPCTTANGCFKKVNQDGGSTPPSTDYGWAIEISLDLDAVSSACPACNILLVEAEEANAPSSTTVDPLATAVDTAVKLGAKFISNSYGATEASNENDGILKADAISSATHYVHSGVAIFASSGDSGFASSPNNSGDGKGAAFPADVPQVFAVGGTSLAKSTTASRGWAEKVWGPPSTTSGAGNSGCSQFFAKPSYQTSTACKGREIADLSAVADPATGLNIYITYTDPDKSASDYFPPGWGVVGGTSLASPLTAAIFAASGLVGTDPSFVYKNASDFNDVTSGDNGTCKEHTLCNGVTGYDGPTGEGTPDGAKLNGK